MKKFVSVVLVLIMVLAFAGLCFAEEEKYNLQLRQEAVQTRLEQIRLSPRVDAPRFLGEELDFWSEFVKRVLKTGTLVAIQKQERFIAGFEVSFWESKNLEAICGVVPMTDESAKFFWGVELTGLPVISDFARTFKRFDPGIVFYDGKARFSVSFVWQEEEVKKRYAEE